MQSDEAPSGSAPRRVRTKEAARHLGIDERALRSLVSAELIPHLRISPRLVLFDLDQLDEWLKARTVPAAGARR